MPIFDVYKFSKMYLLANTSHASYTLSLLLIASTKFSDFGEKIFSVY